MYEINILPNRRLPAHLFCTHALKSSLECASGTVLEPLFEKNDMIKPTCHKNLSGKVVLTDFLRPVSKTKEAVSFF